MENTLDIIDNQLETNENELYVDYKYNQETDTYIVEHNADDLIEFANSLREYIKEIDFNLCDMKRVKGQRTVINKIIKKIDDCRKETLNNYTKPMNDFEKKMKEAAKILKEAELDYKEFVDENKTIEKPTIVITKIYKITGDLKAIEKLLKIEGLTFEELDNDNKAKTNNKEEREDKTLW